MSNHTADLIGRSFRVSIGEPWGFESAAGKSRLLGRITGVIFTKDGSPLILCEVTPFISHGHSVSSVVAVNRYKGTQDVIGCLATASPVTMNFVFQTSGESVRAETVEAVLNQKSGSSFLVGTMELTAGT